MLDWISTEGGPTVVLQAATAGEWGGGICDENETDDMATWGDYGLACAVYGYHGLVEFGSRETPRQALVLGDEPLDAAFLAEHRCIVRWEFAYSEDQILAMIEAQLPAAQWESPLEWEVPSGGLVMIDSACLLSEYEPGGIAERAPVRIDLPPGRYRTQVARVANQEGSAAAVLHRFRPVHEVWPRPAGFAGDEVR